jgi:hypothetical protein
MQWLTKETKTQLRILFETARTGSGILGGGVTNIGTQPVDGVIDEDIVALQELRTQNGANISGENEIAGFSIFAAPTTEETARVRAAKQMLDKFSDGPSYIEAVKYLGIINPFKPALEGFRAGKELLPFQVSGVAWMKQKLLSVTCCILADEMGLGKTIQTLSTLYALSTEQSLHNRPKVSLIVVPPNKINTWDVAMHEWLDCFHGRIYNSGSQHFVKTDPFFYGGVSNLRRIILTTYQIAVRHSFEKRAKWARETERPEYDWLYDLQGLIGTLAIDEVQGIKAGRHSFVHNALKGLHPERVIALTGAIFDNVFSDAEGPFSLIDTDKLWVDRKVPPNVDVYQLQNDHPDAILQKTFQAYRWHIKKRKAPDGKGASVDRNDPVSIGMRLSKMLSWIFRRNTYDT